MTLSEVDEQPGASTGPFELAAFSPTLEFEGKSLLHLSSALFCVLHSPALICTLSFCLCLLKLLGKSPYYLKGEETMIAWVLLISRISRLLTDYFF